MSAGLEFPSMHISNPVKIISPVPPSSFNPTGMNRLEGRPVVRSLEQLGRGYIPFSTRGEAGLH
jgi:hypothetical protein